MRFLISSLLATSISEPIGERIRCEPIDFVKDALVGDRAPSNHVD